MYVECYIRSYIYEDGEPLVCEVCDDTSTGFHYGVLTCEGCKSFFKRTVQKHLNYFCKFDGTCNVSEKETRNSCQKCRYDRCISKGMKTELVINYEQRRAKTILVEKNRERVRLKELDSSLLWQQLKLQQQQFQAAIVATLMKLVNGSQILPTIGSVQYPEFLREVFARFVHASVSSVSPSTSAMNQPVVSIPYIGQLSTSFTSPDQASFTTVGTTAVTVTSATQTPSISALTIRNPNVLPHSSRSMSNIDVNQYSSVNHSIQIVQEENENDGGGS